MIFWVVGIEMMFYRRVNSQGCADVLMIICANMKG